MKSTPQGAPTPLRGLTHSLDFSKEGLAVNATQTCLCSAPGCEKLAKSRGLCGTHYMRFQRTGLVGTAPIRDSGVKSLAERFWSKVNKDGPIVRPELGRCWTWTAATNQNGYGVMRPAGQRSGPTVKAHRVSAELAGMDIEGRFVLHACDNPPCVNPAHLRPGAPIDNAADRVERGQQTRGERTGTHKLTEHQVVQIRELVATGMMHKFVAERFGVSRSTVTHIANGRGWTHVA